MSDEPTTVPTDGMPAEGLRRRRGLLGQVGMTMLVVLCATIFVAVRTQPALANNSPAAVQRHDTVQPQDHSGDGDSSGDGNGKDKEDGQNASPGTQSGAKGSATTGANGSHAKAPPTPTPTPTGGQAGASTTPTPKSPTPTPSVGHGTLGTTTGTSNVGTPNTGTTVPFGLGSLLVLLGFGALRARRRGGGNQQG